jgi:hypothetical protein
MKKNYFNEDGWLTDEGLLELRGQVRICSVYYSDFENTLGLTTASVMDFFDNYTNYIHSVVSEEFEEVPEGQRTNMTFDDLWDKYETNDALLDFYHEYDSNPFKKDEPEVVKEDRRVREEYSFVKPGEVVRYQGDMDYSSRLVKVVKLGNAYEELMDEDTFVTVQENGGKKRDVYLHCLSKLSNPNSESAENLKRNLEAFETFKDGTWQRNFFSNCCDDLYYGYFWEWIKKHDPFVKEYGEDECKKVYDVAMVYMETSD